MTVYRIQDITTGNEFECSDDERILNAAERQGIELPYSCRAGACATCAAILVSGSVEQSDGTFLCKSQQNGFLLTCVSYPTSDCVIKTGSESFLYDNSQNQNILEDLYNEYESISNSLSDFINSSGAGELVKGLLAPVDAFRHYVFGDGTDRSININDVGFNISVTEIPEIMDIINGGGIGSFEIDSKFPRNTMNDSFFIAAYLGHINMTTYGTLNVSADGSWNYNGTINTSGDTYNANASTHRDALGEWSTTILRELGGTPYKIHIPGDLIINENGRNGESLTKDGCLF
ncbi:ferredoxin [Brenneria roseae subsp. roseae]|uniref:lipid II-degrading bacteriocin n=1 Tax=Brenneria roseae TaxID=1509241 RepID=UPI000D6121D2|nr:lipid II-degrading bacteriocin [Brenneria roseae]PWC17140.1 ferredoxin [Brenneria roseae subsp. roseae]